MQVQRGDLGSNGRACCQPGIKRLTNLYTRQAEPCQLDQHGRSKADKVEGLSCHCLAEFGKIHPSGTVSVVFGVQVVANEVRFVYQQGGSSGQRQGAWGQQPEPEQFQQQQQPVCPASTKLHACQTLAFSDNPGLLFPFPVKE